MRTKLLLSLLIIVLLFSFTASNSFSQLPGYRFAIPVMVKNNSGGAVTDLQVPIRVNTQVLIALGWLQPDGKDIRVGGTCSGTPNIDYYIQGYMNTDSTLIWVKVPSIPANDSVKIFMFCGNPAASPASTLSIFVGPFSSVDSVTTPSTNTVSNCQRGYRFTPTANLLVTHFGKRIPNATQRYVTMFDFTTQAIIYQMQVDAGVAGQYNYNTVANPYWLNSGQQYLIELFNGNADMYYFGPPTTTSEYLTYNDMRYCNSCTQNTFPTTILTGQHYGVPDFLYYIKQNVTPAPSFTFYPGADTNAPTAPTSLTAIPGNQNVALKWAKNPELDMSKYYIYQNTTNNPSTATLRDSTVHPDTAKTIGALNNGTPYYFWVKAVDAFCSPRLSAFSLVASATPVVLFKNEEQIPKVFALYQNYPNPFNPSTLIKFDLPKSEYVEFNIYDIAGRLVESIIDRELKAGVYTIDWNAQKYSSGVYFYKLTAGDFEAKKKMILVK
jgi:hypothetical protein